MHKNKLQAAALAGHADETEAQFYEALREADIEKLMRCWADEDEISCVQPGGRRLIGAGMIRRTFEAMFANGSMDVTPMSIHKLEGLSCAVHSVVERIDVQLPEGDSEAYVVATNVYHKTAQGWRMVAHHASPTTAQALQDVHSASTSLH